MRRRVHLTHDVGESLGGAIFHQEAVARGLTRTIRDTWPTSAKLEVEDALWSLVEPGSASALVELSDGTLGLVTVSYGGAYAHVAAASPQAAEAAMKELRNLLPRAKRDREGRVPVTFWSYAQHGPMPMSRRLAVPTWEEIAGNYPAETAAELARLMAGDLPWRGGQLILWHGETGTGKTTALRALAREWSSWCEPHYVTDPEKFFGGQSDYMLSVMIQHDFLDEDEEEAVGYPPAVVMHAGAPGWTQYAIGRGGGPDGSQARTWRLLILEDTGELLSADARQQAGQGLSRFLNVVDGLIGQGLRILVLVTTNEEIGRLHPAVARPGRCAANVLFTRIPPAQANPWLAERGHEGTVTEPLTLAALYARVEGWDVVAERQATGFG